MLDRASQPTILKQQLSPDSVVSADISTRIQTSGSDIDAVLRMREFPKPLHAVWDLDTLVQKSTDSIGKDELPEWIRLMSEQEANRLFIILKGCLLYTSPSPRD